MAMDKLNSEQNRLCEWLSNDPEYILNQCGNILSMNEYVQVMKQNDVLEKMMLLLKTVIQKGEVTCQTFVDILREHQGHYPHLQLFFQPNTQGSSTPTIVADNSSVVTAKQMKNIKANSITMNIETVSAPGGSHAGNVTGQLPQADYIATGGSVICADQFCNITTDGDINLSVTVKAPQELTDTAKETLPSSQGPDVKTIREHKVKLTGCLCADCSFILQQLHAKSIVTDREYQNLKEIPLSEDTVTKLIDLLINKGQESCSRFIQVLKDPEVLSTYPQLENMTRSWC